MEHDYGKAFRIIRAAFGLGQAELASRIPVSASQLSLIEAGKRKPSLRLVNSLAAAVGVPVALVSLLASSPNEVDARADEDISDLARALLRLLVTAKDLPQSQLKLVE